MAFSHSAIEVPDPLYIHPRKSINAALGINDLEFVFTCSNLLTVRLSVGYPYMLLTINCFFAKHINFFLIFSIFGICEVLEFEIKCWNLCSLIFSYLEFVKLLTINCWGVFLQFKIHEVGQMKIVGFVVILSSYWFCFVICFTEIMVSKVTLRVWHGGHFEKHPSKEFKEYVGGEVRSFVVDPDTTGWWDLEEMAEKCGTYKKTDEIFYLQPGSSLDKGLVNLGKGKDVDVMTMLELACQYGTIDVYVSRSGELKSTPSKAKTPIESPSKNWDKGKALLEYERAKWVDDRPPSPVSLQELIGGGGSDSESNSLYEPSSDLSESDETSFIEEEGVEGELLEAELNDELTINDVGDDTSDEEFHENRDSAKGFSMKLMVISQTLQKNASLGRLGEQLEGGSSRDVLNITEGEHDGNLSEFSDTEDETHTPDGSGDEENRTSSRRLIVEPSTDFTTFVWKVGHRFPNRASFRSAVGRYAVLQGKNLTFIASNKNRGQRLGVRCVKNCPFKVYASWDKSSACFVVKTMTNVHTCHRNMKKNGQLKSSFLAKELLPMFKSRPHWPAKEIVETVRQGFRVLITLRVAYKVKYLAHKLLYGSMTEHYNKLGRYLEAVKNSSPKSRIILLTDPRGVDKPPVFQRLHICFEGVERGWLVGCRKLIVIDACFLKTFLGGQLMVAVGRDGNDQMFPIAWAAVEGENNESWGWFIQNLQSSLQLDDGSEIVIISDKHQVLFFLLTYQIPYLAALMTIAYYCAGHFECSSSNPSKG